MPASAQQMVRRGVCYFPIRSPSAVTRIDAAWRLDNRSTILASFIEIARSVARP